MLSTAALIGIATGAAITLCVLLICCSFICCRRQPQPHNSRGSLTEESSFGKYIVNALSFGARHPVALGLGSAQAGAPPPPPAPPIDERNSSGGASSSSSSGRRGSVKRSSLGAALLRKSLVMLGLAAPEETTAVRAVVDDEAPRDEGPLLERANCTKLDAAVEEIVKTEGDYCLALRTLTEGYMPRLVPNLEGDERATIFSNAQTILGVHNELHNRLQAARSGKGSNSTLREEVAAVSAAFQAILPFLKLYSTYCANYVAALEALERARAERPALATAIQRAEVEIATHRQGEGDLRLASCLIRPVKRLCLYPLLLTALLKEFADAEKKAAATAGSGEDLEAGPPKSSLREALSDTADAVQAMASQVNTMVQEAENRVRMMELHERLHGLYPGLVTPTRRFVRTDRVQVAKHDELHSHPPLKKYELWLLSDRLLLTRPDRSARSALAYLKVKCDLPLEDTILSWQRPTRGSAAAAVEDGGGHTSFWVTRRGGERSSNDKDGDALYCVHFGEGERYLAEQLYNSYEAQMVARRKSELTRATMRERLHKVQNVLHTVIRNSRRSSESSSADDHRRTSLDSRPASSMPTSPRSPEHLNRDGTLKQMIGGNGDLRQSINLRSFKGGMKSIALSFRKNPSISSKKGVSSTVGTRCCNGNGGAATTAAKAASPLPPTDTSPLTVIVERNSGGDSRESSRRQSTEQAPTSLGPAPADSGISLVLSESGQSLLPDEESILELSGRTTLTAATESCDSIGGLSEASGLGRAAERSEASACSRSSAVTLSRISYASSTGLPPGPLSFDSTCSSIAPTTPPSGAPPPASPRSPPPPPLLSSIAQEHSPVRTARLPARTDFDGRVKHARRTSLISEEEDSTIAGDVLEAQVRRLSMAAHLRHNTTTFDLPANLATAEDDSTGPE